MQYQVHKCFPYVAECFPAYFSKAKHPVKKPHMRRKKTPLHLAKSLHYAQANLYIYTHACTHTKSLVFDLYILISSAPLTFSTAKH